MRVLLAAIPFVVPVLVAAQDSVGSVLAGKRNVVVDFLHVIAIV
jgi:hypothetical protein